MFYLKQFFKSLSQNKVNGIGYLLMTGLFVFTLFNRPLIKKTLDHRNNEKQLSYFKALLDGKINLSAITRKMNDLPGVHEVKINKKIVLNSSDIAELKSIAPGEMLSNFVNEDYASIKVVLEDNLKVQTKSLIREYLGRLAGTDALTLTSIRNPNSIGQNSKELKMNLLDNIDIIVIAIVSIFWILSSFLYTNKMNEYSLILERFQRRSFLSFKIYMTGLFLFVIFTFIYAVFLNAHDFMIEVSILSSVFGIGAIYSSKDFLLKKLT